MRRSKLCAQNCASDINAVENSGNKEFQIVGLSSNKSLNDYHETSIFTFPHLN